MSKESRNYRNTLDFVESGFVACWLNAGDLVSASQQLIDSGLHAPALSLAVLALEELGKLFAIDGLLFARHDDHKAAAFTNSYQKHSLKLEIFELFPFLLLNLSRADPRFGKEQEYNRAVAMSVRDLKDAGNAVMLEAKKAGFVSLDKWKQSGLYASEVGRGLLAPREAVKPSLAKAAHRLAWRAATTLDFVLKDGNLGRYIENARSVRAKLTEEEHKELERLGEELAGKLFCGPSDGRNLQARETAPGGTN